MAKQPIIVVLGPTASGKTALAVELAKLYNGEVISADSMQIYKGMDILTAKPTEEEKQGIKHHLMDFLEPETDFSVADYVKLANMAVDDISRRGKIPILTGGTGLYINSLIDNIKFDDTTGDKEYRERLFAIANEKGNHYLWERLLEVDKETALSVHENNISRVIRALEVYEKTGERLSEHKKSSRLEESRFEPAMIGLTFSDRQMLYDRINKRVDTMIANGLVKEAEEIYYSRNLNTAHQAIGYKELIPYFEGQASLEDCIEKIKMETRRYAKRQLTWFRRDKRINWIEVDKYKNIEEILENVKKYIAICINL